ncbi:hypothetical protein C0993_006450 [Termitomyces sp. T159_Od127]|nr:hypothetical protein C0993_006450 [Termitomyces sp. T159_Od127]
MAARPFAGRHRWPAAARDRAAQIRNDGAIARQLQEQEEELLAAASIRSANERHIPFEPPVVPSDPGSDEESTLTPPTPPPPGARTLDANGAYSPEPYHARVPRRHPAPVVPPPVLDTNGAYTPPPFHRPVIPAAPPRPRQPAPPAAPPVVPPAPQRSRQPTPFIPPVVPPTPDARRPAQPPPVIPPVVPPATSPPRARDRMVTFQEPPRPAPFIPPLPPLHSFHGAHRAATPVPPRPSPTYWYPAGFVPPPVYAPTPVVFYPQPLLPPPGAVVPAPPIPPFVRPPPPGVVASPPQKKAEDVVVPFIPPMVEEKPTAMDKPRSVLKSKSKPVEKPIKVVPPSDESDESEPERERIKKPRAREPERGRTRAREHKEQVEREGTPKAKPKEEREGTPKAKPKEMESEDGADLALRQLHKHKPIHKEVAACALPALDTHLHLACTACRTTYCRGCRRPAACKRTCTASPSSKCALRTCCRAGRAIAVFLILSAFDAALLALAHARPSRSFHEYTAHALRSRAAHSALSSLLETTIPALLPWLAPTAHAHPALADLLRVSALLDVVHAYLRAPRETWVRRAHACAYERMLEMLRRLENAGRGALKGLVFGRRRGVAGTRGVGRAVWAMARGRGGDALGWAAGAEQESFSEILSQGRVERDLLDMRDRVRAEGDERGALVDRFLCQTLWWRMAHVLE